MTDTKQNNQNKVTTVIFVLLVAFGLFLIIKHAPHLAHLRSIRLFIDGWLCFLVGLAILLLAGHTFWPELILAVVIVLVVVGLPALPVADEADKSAKAKVPIPAAKVEGGADFLSPGQIVDLVAFAPNPRHTPERQVSTYGKVLEVRGGKDNLVILMAVPADSAADLQKALLATDAKLAYQLLSATPTATLTPTPTLTPTKTPQRPIPEDGWTYVEIAVDKVKPRASTLRIGEEARLVIVEKYVSPTGTPEAVSTTHKNEEFCVTVVRFLDENGLWQDSYDKDKTKQVLLEMNVGELARFAGSMAATENIWMVNDTTCEP